MSSRTGDGLHWDGSRRRAILSPSATLESPVLMLAAAWITFLRSEAKA